MGRTFDRDPASPGPGTGASASDPSKREDGLACRSGVHDDLRGTATLRPWLRKFLQHGNGVAIVRAYTSSSWWHEEMPKAELICFPRGKTKFIRPTGEVGTAPGHGIVLVGAGTVACDALMRSGLGMIWDRRKL